MFVAGWTSSAKVLGCWYFANRDVACWQVINSQVYQCCYCACWTWAVTVIRSVCVCVCCCDTKCLLCYQSTVKIIMLSVQSGGFGWTGGHFYLFLWTDSLVHIEEVAVSLGAWLHFTNPVLRLTCAWIMLCLYTLQLSHFYFYTRHWILVFLADSVNFILAIGVLCVVGSWRCVCVCSSCVHLHL